MGARFNEGKITVTEANPGLKSIVVRSANFELSRVQVIGSKPPVCHILGTNRNFSLSVSLRKGSAYIRLGFGGEGELGSGEGYGSKSARTKVRQLTTTGVIPYHN